MTSDKGFPNPRNAGLDSGYMLKRQSTMVWTKLTKQNSREGKLGSGAEFIQKAIANGMLGSAVASKIQGMFPENYAKWSCVHQLLNLPAPFALENLDIISGNPSYLAVTFFAWLGVAWDLRGNWIF